MGKSGMNLQDSFLNQVRKDNTEIQLMLLDGSRLNGYVRGFDNFTVILGARGQQHLIYKHAIAQIISRRPNHEAEQHHEAAPNQSQGEAAEAQPALEQQDHRDPEERSERPDRHERSDRHERPRRDNAPRRDRDEPQPPKPKFNTIDLSNLKMDEPKG